MYSTTYHNGEYGIELFSPSGNDPFKTCKLNNEHNIKKLYDRTIKGYMIALEKESTTTSIQFPKSSKGSLMITQPVLVLQLQLHPERPFSMEIIVVDTDQQRRRFHLSTNFKDVDVNSLHVCIPWTQPDREQWTSVALNLDGLVSTYHTGKTAPAFFNLEAFTIQPVCRIRKIFTLPLKYLGDEETGPLIPPKFDFTTGVEATSWVFSFDGSAPPPQLSARGEPAERAAAGAGAAAQGPLGIVGKKVARKDAPSTSSAHVAPTQPAAGVTDAGSAQARRQQATEPAFSAHVVPSVTAAKKPHPLVPSLPLVPVSSEDVKPPAMVFSGRLKQKLTSVNATPPAAPSTSTITQGVAPPALSNPAEADCSMLVDASAADIAVDEVSTADVSGLTEGGGEDRTRPQTPPSAEDSANASTLTETETSAHNITSEAVLEVASPEVDEGVLERYLQLRQSMKRGEEPPAPAPHELAQSVHDYSAIEEYVSSYKLHQKLQHVRESLFLAEEEALGLARPTGAAVPAPQGIAAMEEADTDAHEEAEESPASPSAPATPVAQAAAPPVVSSPTQLQPASPMQPRAAPATPPAAPSAPARRFVDAAVSPMPVMRSLQPRAPHLSHSSLPALPEAEVEAPILIDTAVSPVVSPTASLGAPLAEDATGSRPHTPEEAASPALYEANEPVHASVVSASVDSQQRGMQQVPLSPFSEAVAYIQASQPSLQSSKEPPLDRSTQSVARSTELPSSRSSRSDTAPSGPRDSENAHPNVHVQEDLAGSDFAVYKARSSALAEQYERSVEALLGKLEQKGRVNTEPRSPLHSRPGTAASTASASRSGNTHTAVLSTPLPEKRKRAIRARVAGLLKQVAQAEMEYIAEFGFEAFEREVGFFEDNLPLKRR